MANMIFVNPSPNAYNLSKELIRKGNEVLFVNNKEIPTITPENVVYFYDKGYVLFNAEAQDKVELDDRMNLFKSGFFTKIKMMSVSNNLMSINRTLAAGNFTDLTMFRSKTIVPLEKDLPSVRSYDNLSEIIATYPRHSIFSSALKGEGSSLLVTYSSDYDFKSAFGNDYYVLFVQGTRIEMFVHKNSIVIISRLKKPIETLIRAFPNLSKFHFNIDKSFTILKNHTPHINYDFISKTIVLNDYSFGKSSIKVDQSFCARLANYIDTSK